MTSDLIAGLPAKMQKGWMCHRILFPVIRAPGSSFGIQPQPGCVGHSALRADQSPKVVDDSIRLLHEFTLGGHNVRNWIWLVQLCVKSQSILGTGWADGGVVQLVPEIEADALVREPEVV